MKRFLTDECVEVLTSSLPCDLSHVPQAHNKKRNQDFDEAFWFDFKVEQDGQKGVMHNGKLLPMKAGGVIAIFPTFTPKDTDKVIANVTEENWNEFIDRVVDSNGKVDYNGLQTLLKRSRIRFGIMSHVPGFDWNDNKGSFVWDRDGEKQYLTRYYFSYENPEITDNVFSHLETDAS
jgi:hypothetical protein